MFVCYVCLNVCFSYFCIFSVILVMLMLYVIRIVITIVIISSDILEEEMNRITKQQYCLTDDV